MKKILSQIIQPLFFAVLLFCSSAASSQVIQKKKLTEAELKEENKLKQIGNYLDKISASEKQKGKEKAQLTMLYLAKGVLHRADKNKYPVDADKKSTERVVADYVEGMSPAMYEKINGRIKAMLADNGRKATALGKYSGIDLTQQTKPQLVKMPGLKISEVEYNNKVVADLPPTFDLLLSAVHCMDETDPESGDDDIVVGALLSGPGNKIRVANAVFCGRFDDGDNSNMGDYQFGKVSMSNQSYPKTFYTVFQMVEADYGENEAALELNELMNYVITIIDPQETQSAGVMAAMIGYFASYFSEEGFMETIAVKMELRSANELYVNDIPVPMANGISDGWKIMRIDGHSGLYRVKLKIRVSN